MAKVKRSVLKEIVKECLLEILFEGIDSESGFYEEEEPIREARQPRRTSRPSNKPQRKKSLHDMVEERQGKTSKKKVPLREEKVQAAVSELTSDPMMASIFADTAQTTLQEQREGRNSYIPADKAAAVVQNADDLENIFEGAQNWAAIAFNEVDK